MNLNSYEKLNEYLGNRHSKLVKKSRAQTIATRNVDGSISVVLYDTDIITFYDCGRIILDSGGWETATTKRRINDHLPKNVYLHQDNHTWYLACMIRQSQRWHTVGKIQFEDNMEIPQEWLKDNTNE